MWSTEERDFQILKRVLCNWLGNHLLFFINMLTAPFPFFYFCHFCRNWTEAQKTMMEKKLNCCSIVPQNYFLQKRKKRKEKRERLRESTEKDHKRSCIHAWQMTSHLGMDSSVFPNPSSFLLIWDCLVDPLPYLWFIGTLCSFWSIYLFSHIWCSN